MALSSNTSGDYFEDSRLAKDVWVYGSGVIIVVGTVGNTLSVIVMSSSRLRKQTTALYLAVLSLVDLAVLYSGLLRHWIRALSGVDIRSTSTASCKLHIFVVYFLMQFEAWLLVLVSLERLVAVYIPHRVRAIFTKKNAAIQMLVTALALMVVDGHFFWTHSLVGGICDVAEPKYAYFVDVVWCWLDLVLASLAPFVVILALNCAIITQVVRLERKRRKNRMAANGKRTNAMTGLLITTNCIFLLATAPIAVYIGMQSYLSQMTTEWRLELVWACLNMIAYAHYSINFALYCFSSPVFRLEFFKALRLERCLRKVYPGNESAEHTNRSTVREG